MRPNIFLTRYLLVLAAMAVYLLSSQSTLQAATRYVNNSVAISGDGSLNAPWKTLQEGISNLSPGDTLLIRGDSVGQIYNETLSFAVSGTAMQPITLKAHPNEKVILTGTSGTRLNLNRDSWILDGLIIDQANIASDAIKINASNITIRNSEIRNGQREGIAIEKASFVTIEDSYIHDFMWISSTGTRNDAHCIMIDTGLSSTITDIKIHRNTIEKCSGDGTQIFGVTGQPISTYAKNIEFVDNTFLEGTSTSGITENALDFKAADTVLIKGNTMTGYKNNKTIVIQKGSRNITIEKNTISNGLSGIEMRQEGGASFIQENQRMTGNIIHHMSSFAIKLDGTLNVTITNNTLADIGAESFRFESSLGSSISSVNGGLIKNNLFYKAGGAPTGTSLLSNVDVGHNGWFQSVASGLSRTTDTTGSDPLFVNPLSGNYRLTAGSPVIDQGTGVGLPFIGPAPDLGALEFNPGGDATPPAPPSGLIVK